MVIDHGLIPMSKLFKKYFPCVTYNSAHSKRKLLQMPLAAVRLRSLKASQSEIYIMEKVNGFNYVSFAKFLTKNLQLCSHKRSQITKEELQRLLLISQTDRERKLIRYAVFKASGISSSAAKRLYGFENTKILLTEVEDCITEVERIRKDVETLAGDQHKAMLQCYGFSDSSDADSEIECFVQESEGCNIQKFRKNYPTDQSLMIELQASEMNWFNFVDRLENVLEITENVHDILEEFKNHIQLDSHKMETLKLSYDAYIASRSEQYAQERTVRTVNGDIVSETESDNPNDYITPSETARRALVEKKIRAIQTRARRQRAKLIAEQRFLSRTVGKRTSKIMTECPDIGKTMEKFVEDHNVGADAWRRTGVLTFDGNANLKSKVTYQKIQQHLQEVYSRSFSYGTVVELCVARNKKRRSSQRYKGVAQITTRRARKGFSLKYNPDAHWSAALYQGLNKIQYIDGTNILNLNRDDATGFRLDTLSTCKQFSTPSIIGKDILTTRTDFVNKYNSTLQTTSYYFSATNTTQEVCVGSVKATPLHQKNPAQHISDLWMLSGLAELKPVFFKSLPRHSTSTKERCLQTLAACSSDDAPSPLCPESTKDIDCIRVDGASDEGPSHDEVQFWWTEWHLMHNKLVTLVTTRSSGSSYLNKVELMNGCIALGHSNTFIPSTLGGGCFDEDTGAVSQDKLKHNLELAITAYISRVNGCKCGDTVVKLYEGVRSNERLSKRARLNTFLKGSLSAKEVLKRDYPEDFTYFQKVWDLRRRHMIEGLPNQYIFFLRCCFQSDCPHVRCQSQPECPPCWYEGGPPITHLYLPLCDPEKPWGSTSCLSCKERTCGGHYIVKLVDTSNKESLDSLMKPPSVIIKQRFMELKGELVSEEFVETLSKDVLLTSVEVKIWLDHLSTVFKNRKRGAAKSAASRKAKRQKQTVDKRHKGAALTSTIDPNQLDQNTGSSEDYCGTCRVLYSTSTAEFWVGCDACDIWYCGPCEELSTKPTSEVYFCKKCLNKN